MTCGLCPDSYLSDYFDKFLNTRLSFPQTSGQKFWPPKPSNDLSLTQENLHKLEIRYEIYSASNTTEKLEYNLISKANIEEFQLLEQNQFVYDDQKYDIVPGFESLRNISLITISTIFFRNKDQEGPYKKYI